MRVIVLAGLIATSPANASTSDRALTTDIDRSEWHPATKLSLDIDTGRYRIIPPQDPWPKLYPKPEARSGIASKALRRELRRAFDAAAVDLADPRCAVAPRGGIIVSNAGPIELVLHVAGKPLRSGRLADCWTPAVKALQRLLQERFGRPRAQ